MRPTAPRSLAWPGSSRKTTTPTAPRPRWPRSRTRRISPPGLPDLAFDPAKDLGFDYGPALPGHANGMILKATDAEGDVILEETYYSIGGGFVLTAAELAEAGGAKSRPCRCALALRDCGRNAGHGASLGPVHRADETANELKFRSGAELDRGLARIWEVMNACIAAA
jgi:L-serine dehydratase